MQHKRWLSGAAVILIVGCATKPLEAAVPTANSPQTAHVAPQREERNDDVGQRRDSVSIINQTTPCTSAMQAELAQRYEENGWFFIKGLCLFFCMAVVFALLENNSFPDE
jgi:hypothetical protein